MASIFSKAATASFGATLALAFGAAACVGNGSGADGGGGSASSSAGSGSGATTSSGGGTSSGSGASGGSNGASATTTSSSGGSTTSSGSGSSGGGSTGDAGSSSLDAGPQDAGPSTSGCPSAGGSPPACSAPGGLLAQDHTEILAVGLSQTTSSSPQQLAAADFNRDGLTDLAVGNFEGTVQLLLGAGDGGFSALSPVATGQKVLSLTTGDFNGDCLPDVAYGAGDQVFVLLGNGDGTFQPGGPGAAIDSSGNGRPLALAAADLNRDGRLDLVVAGAAGTQIAVLLGKGDGTFQPPTLYPAGAHVGSVAIADLNRDGWLDVAASSEGPQAALEAAVLLNRGDGSLASALLLPTGDTDSPTGIVATDLNGDGWPDLALVGSLYCQVDLLLGAGDGGFSAATPYPLPFTTPSSTMSMPGPIVAADLNGDGILDLAASAWGDVGVGILIGDGHGGFTGGGTLAAGSAAQPSPTFVAAWSAYASTPPHELAISATSDGPSSSAGTVTILASDCP